MAAGPGHGGQLGHRGGIARAFGAAGASGRNVFQGGFLGLDNIGVFDRSAACPAAGTSTGVVAKLLQQSGE